MISSPLVIEAGGVALASWAGKRENRPSIGKKLAQ
jgi:hypothetical protein